MLDDDNPVNICQVVLSILHDLLKIYYSSLPFSDLGIALPCVAMHTWINDGTANHLVVENRLTRRYRSGPKGQKPCGRAVAKIRDIRYLFILFTI